MQFTIARPLAPRLISGILLSVVSLAGCSPAVSPPAAEIAPEPMPTQAEPPAPTQAPAALSMADPLVAAEDAAQGAIVLMQSAVSPEDWQPIAQQWERAIALLELVPESDPKIATARDKLEGYRENLAHARQKARQSAPPAPQSSRPLPPGAIAITGPASGKTGKAAANVAPEDAPKLALAQHLSQTGAKLYVTASCEGCQYQRSTFGTAAGQLAEVECTAEAREPKADACQKAGVSSFPSWQVNGKLYPGVRSLDELAQLSGFEGDRNFSPSPPKN